MFWHLVAACAALTVFLLGLRVMRDGLAAMADGSLRHWLLRLARTPSRGIVTGIVATALIQSSAAVTAICVGLVAAGSMPFRHALGIVVGANVGSTVTPQMLAFGLWGLALPALLIGALVAILGPSRLRPAGLALAGLGGMLVGLDALSHSLAPLSQTPAFAGWLAHASHNVWWAAAAGCLASAAIQSSTATTLITMTLCDQHIIPTMAGIAIVLGANVGTCATAVIAAIGQPRAAMQVALGHVILNVLGVLAVLPWLPLYASWVDLLGGDAARHIANAHTLFNVLSTLAVWPITTPYARFIERLWPDQRRT